MNLRYESIPHSFYVRNRETFSGHLKSNSVAVIMGKSKIRTNADGQMGFRQSTGFFYLAGIDQEDCALIISKGQHSSYATLFIPETNPQLATWEGEKLNKIEAETLSGISEIVYFDSFWEKLKKAVSAASHVYVYIDKEIVGNTWNQDYEKQLQTKLKRLFPHKNYHNPASIINKLRMVKDEREIIQIKKAIQITSQGLNRFCSELKAGVFEFELEAAITHVFMKNRSRFHAFEPIIASGLSACTLHYTHNANKIQAGQCVLLDFGAEYGNYAADVTRVLPIDGCFDARQKELYGAVLEVFKDLKKMIKPGIKLSDIRIESKRLMGKQLLRLGIIKKIRSEYINQYYPHGPSHFLGLDVHDVGDRNALLEPGMVVTCEPGMYVPEECIGIRLENDLLITDSGNVDLCEYIPIEITEIENLLR